MQKIFTVSLLVSLYLTSALASSVNFSQTKVDSLENLLKIRKDKSQIFYELSVQYASVDKEKELDYLFKAVADFNGNTKIKLQYLVYNRIGIIYYLLGDSDKCLFYFNKALQSAKNLENDTLIASGYNNIGLLYESKADYSTSIEYMQKALEINQRLKLEKEKAINYNNIGLVYYKWKDYKEAIKYFKKSIELNLLSNNQDNISIAYSNLGICYFELNYTDKAISYYQTAISIDSANNNISNISQNVNNLGKVYYKKNNKEKSLEYFQLALDIAKSNKNKKNYALYAIDLAKVYGLMYNDYKKAISFLNISKEICLNNNYEDVLLTVYDVQYQLFLKHNKFKQALEAFLLKTEIKDSIFNKSSRATLENFRVKYESVKRESEIKMLKKDKLITEQRIKRQHVIIIVASIWILIFVVVLFLLVKAYKSKKKALSLIEVQKNKLSETNKQIQDSIIYAKNIQKAILTPFSYLDELTEQNFIIIKPKDIISGDFFWGERVGSKAIIAVADCTGHGIPGAIMSMLGASFLNEIVIKDKVTETGKILDRLKKEVVNSLHQTSEVLGSKDGMDISLCIIDYEKMTIQYSGAYNPLIIVKDGNLTEIKGDKMPIGFYEYEDKLFETKNITFEKNTNIYMFSDGYKDQFGGEKDKKLGKNAFYKLIQQNSQLNMLEQKEKLLEFHDIWRRGGEQVDDILVVGIRL